MTEPTTQPTTVTVSKQDLQTLNWFASLIPTLESQVGRQIASATFTYDGTTVSQSITYVEPPVEPLP